MPAEVGAQNEQGVGIQTVAFNYISVGLEDTTLKMSATCLQ